MNSRENEKLEIKIITGLSGAGKSQFLKALEDLSYYAVDHLPVALLTDFVKIVNEQMSDINKVAIVIDIREIDFFDKLFTAIKEIQMLNVDLEIIYLEAAHDVLLKRFRETRRRHPLSKDLRILDAIKKEEELITPIKYIAHRHLDTSHFTTAMLKEYISNIYSSNPARNIIINIVSFGYKYGPPLDGDFMYDVRFIPNPYYDDDCRNRTGKDKQVYDFVMKYEETRLFINKLAELMDFVAEQFSIQGRDNIVVCIGCTGGQHRSVVISEKLSDMMRENGYFTTLNHRDIWRAGGIKYE